MSEVNISEASGIRYLHLGTPWVQGSMKIKKPFDIDLEYVQRMMAWLLFTDFDKVRGAHAMQLGLGAGAISKFCYQSLEMTCTTVEINPRVADICHAWFCLPEEDERFRLVFNDAGKEIKSYEWAGCVDFLAVDLYDHQAAAPVLDSPEFYADCRNVLTSPNELNPAGGIMTVNLFGRSSSFDKSLEHITKAFGKNAVWVFKPTREGNTIVLALKSAQDINKDIMDARADYIQERFKIPARKWRQMMKLCN